MHRVYCDPPESFEFLPRGFALPKLTGRITSIGSGHRTEVSIALDPPIRFLPHLVGAQLPFTNAEGTTYKGEIRITSGSHDTAEGVVIIRAAEEVAELGDRVVSYPQ